MARSMRTNLVRGIVGVAAAWALQQALIGFRRGVAEYVAKEAAENQRRVRGAAREPLNLYGTPENYLAHLNIAYGAIVREAKGQGTIPQDHPETLPDRAVSHVRIVRRKPGADGPFVGVKPGDGFQA